MYESLIIRQPLQRIAEARKSFDESNKIIYAMKRRHKYETLPYLRSLYFERIMYIFQVENSAVVVERYLYNLKTHTKISKL